MKKIFLLILGFVMFKVGYSQYPIQQFIGADSAVVTSKGGLQGRFINVVFADTTAANSQRVRQYPGAMIYASGKLWVRNTTATGWTELAYGPITPVNIYNSDGTLTGPRTLDGNNDDLTFDNVAYFTVSGNPLGQIRFAQGSNSNIFMRGDTTAISRRLSYNTNLRSSFTKHSLVDKNYVDSSISTVPSVNIYNSNGTLTGNRELDGDGNNLTFTAVKKFEFSGDSLYYLLDPAGNLRLKLGNQQFTMQGDTASLSRRISYTGNLGSSFTKHSLVDRNYVDSSITASPSGTVTSVATNNATGITGGPITTTGTLAIDTNLISTRAWRQKGVDSVASLPKVTSVGLSMPTAFAVANSPVTSSGTLTVTGAGVASQYIRGDGQLATLPTTGGGGSSVSYYLNGSVNQGTFGGTPYYEMSKTPIFGAGTDFTISSNGYIASFITDAGDPALLNIPAGNWDFEVYFQSSSASGTPSFYVELYKYDGSTFTLIASSSANPEFITGGTSVDAYYTPLAVPSTSLLVTDRLAVRIYVNNSGNTITLHTEDNNLCQIITTFSTGINALNGLTSQVQYFATGTSGTDFNINSATDTHTFNLPTASATNRGALSSADWSTFNSKIGPSDTSSMLSPYLRKVDTTAMLSPYKTFYPRTAISLTTTGSSGAATYDNSTGVLNIPQYTDQFTGTVTSVATNTATGITGGTITTTGTLAIDTNLISTRAWRQKGIDSVASLANSKIGGSGTTNYVSKFTASGTIGNSQIFDNGTSVGIGTATPAAKLDVSADNNEIRSTGSSVGYTQYNAFITSGVNMRIGAYATNYGFLGTTNNYPFLIQTNNVERARFTAAGRLLIGTSTESTYELDVVGDIRSTLDANINGLTVGKGGGSIANNTAIGISALNANTTGDYNTAIGRLSLQLNTTGTGNIALGWASGYSQQAGSYNLYLGYGAGFYDRGSNNIFLGFQAGYHFTFSTSSNNIGIGLYALNNVDAGNNIALGNQASKDITTGIYNTIVGTNASTSNGITTGNYNTIIGSQITGLSTSLSNTIILADGQGNQRLYINNSGNVGIGTTSPSAKLQINRTDAVPVYLSGESYSILANYTPSSYANPNYNASIRGNLNAVNAGTFTGYRSAGVYGHLSIGSSQYTFTSGHVFSGITSDVNVYGTSSTANKLSGIQTNVTVNSGNSITDFYHVYTQNQTLFGTITNHWGIYQEAGTKNYFSGNVLIGTTTDAGYKLDVNGTARVKEYLYLQRSDGAATIAALTYQPGNTIDIGNTFRVLGTNKWQNTVGSSSYIENNYFTKVFASVPQTNGSWTMYDFQLFSSMAPTVASSYNQKVIGTAFTIQSTAVNSFFGVDVRATDNSSSIANNVYGVYADATLGTNTSATRWAGYFVGRGYFSQVLAIGTTSPNASALLDVSSTTKGFLPPRMTGAQAEAIGTPAAGLLVYSTDGSGATITSLGWWGYNGTTWVKLN